MAYDAGGAIDLTFKAQEDLSSMQYRFVTLHDDNQVRMLNSATEWPVGILQNNPESGEMAVVRVAGVSKLVAGSGGLSRNDAIGAEYVGASDNGKGVGTTTSADHVRARCLMAAGAEDDVASVLLVDMIYTAVTS
jgi:hypothetical protein